MKTLLLFVIFFLYGVITFGAYILFGAEFVMMSLLAIIVFVLILVLFKEFLAGI